MVELQFEWEFNVHCFDGNWVAKLTQVWNISIAVKTIDSSGKLNNSTTEKWDSFSFFAITNTWKNKTKCLEYLSASEK